MNLDCLDLMCFDGVCGNFVVVDSIILRETG